jgi:lysophospholipase L1-like esterase
MRPLEAGGAALRWHAVNAAAFRLEGFPFYEVDGIYRRLPAKPPAQLPEAVHYLANNTAGGQIRFRSDSGRVAIKVTLSGAGKMVHMAFTGQNGFDLYVGPPAEARFWNAAKYEMKDLGYELMLFELAERETREFTLNFPLYTGVKEVLVGLDPDARVEAPTPRALPGRVVVYGSSITQGGCASRPGTCYTNILSRRLNVEFVNLGFSGNGRGEEEVARSVALVPDPAMFVLDYEANCVSVELLSETLPRFAEVIREQHPETPVLMVSKIRYGREALNPALLQYRTDCMAVKKKLVAERRAAGDARLHFFDSSGVLGEDFDECTVDGVHPTDLGFVRMARGFEPVYREILGLPAG